MKIFKFLTLQIVEIVNEILQNPIPKIQTMATLVTKEKTIYW